MKFNRLLIPILCAGTILSAQGAEALNNLATAAHQFANSQVSIPQVQLVDLRGLQGDSGRSDGAPMTKASDVQRWTFSFSMNVSCPPEMECPRSATCTWSGGQFSDFRKCGCAVLNAKSLEGVPVAVSLDKAVESLNKLGYVHGFSKCRLLKPEQPDLSDTIVYVFDCPSEGATVGISAVTGELVWERHC